MSGYTSNSSSSELAVKLALFFANEQHAWKRMSGTDRIVRIQRILKDAEIPTKAPVRTWRKEGKTFDLTPGVDDARKSIMDEILSLSQTHYRLAIQDPVKRFIKIFCNIETTQKDRDQEIDSLLGSTPFYANVRDIFHRAGLDIPESIVQNLNIISDAGRSGGESPPVVMDFVLENPVITERKKSLGTVLTPRSFENEVQFLLEEDLKLRDTKSTPPVPVRRAPSPPKDEVEMEEIKKIKMKKDPNAPRRPISGYMAYGSKRRPELKISDPNLGFGDITQKIAAEWNGLSDKEKKPFNERANEDKERYAKEYLAYYGQPANQKEHNTRPKKVVKKKQATLVQEESFSGSEDSCSD